MKTSVFRSTIEGMLLERRIIKSLQDYHIKMGQRPNRKAFEEYFVKQRWPRINYFRLSDKEYERKVQLALIDCIGGSKKYINDYRTDDRIQVNDEGRRFINWPYFLSEAALEHKGLGIVFGSGFAAVAIWILKLIFA